MSETFYLFFWIVFISLFSLSLHLLTVESKFKPFTTTILCMIFSCVLIFVNAVIFKDQDLSKFEVQNFITILIPEFFFIYFIGKRGFIATATSTLNTYISIYTVQIIKSTFSRYIPNDYLWTEYIYIVFYPIIWIYIKHFYINLHKEIESVSPSLLKYLLFFSSVCLLEIFAYGYLIQNHIEYSLRIEIFGIAVISIYYISFAIFNKIVKEYKQKFLQLNAQKLKSRELDYIDDRLKIREKKDKELKVIRHDLRHVLITIKQLLYNNNIIEANKIIDKYTEAVDSLQLKSYCNDYVIDSIIDYYAGICEKNNIKFNVQINNFEDILDISNYDFAIFISNCLENAVNASKKINDNRQIDFTLLNNNGRLILQIKNVFNGKIKLDKNGKPISKSKNHGIGSDSIEWFAQRHNLDLSYSITKTIFTISVLFPH